MKALKALWLWIKGLFNDAVENNIDAGVVMKQGIREASESITELRRHLTEVIADRNRIKIDWDAASKNVQKYTQLAQAAMNKGLEDDARRALTESDKAQTRVNQLGSTLQSLNENIDRIKDQIEQLETNRDTAKSNVSVVTARSKAAKASLKSQQVLNRTGDSDMGIAMELAEEALYRDEAHAAAMAEMNGPTDDWESRISGSSNQSIEDRLAAMRKPDEPLRLEAPKEPEISISRNMDSDTAPVSRSYDYASSSSSDSSSYSSSDSGSSSSSSSSD